MPQSFHRFNPEQDGRRKLQSSQYEEIRHRYASKMGDTHQSLADEYGVSKSLIMIILNPERKRMCAKWSNSHWKDYSNREKLTKAAKKTRDKKRKLGLVFSVTNDKKCGTINKDKNV